MPCRWFWVVVLLAACRGAGSEPPAPPPSTPPPEPAPAPPAPIAEPEAGPRLVPLAEKPPISGVRLTIDSPRSGETLSADAARLAKVQVTRAGTIDGASHRVALVLDEHRVRYVDGTTAVLELDELVPEDRDLDVGVHRLAALLVHPEGDIARDEGGAAVVASVRFSVGAAPVSAERPDIVYLEPQGTFNGPDSASRPRLTFALLGPRPAEAGLRATIASDRHRTTAAIEPGVAYALTGLESGDYRVILELVGIRGKPLAEVARTITVNLDAPLPK